MRLAAALVLALALSACGGGGSSLDTSQAVRDKLAASGLECSGYEPNKEVLGAEEDGTCDIDGTTATVTIYKSDEQRKQIREAFSTFASGISVDGERWTVNVPDRDVAAKIAEALGGKVT